MFDTRKSIAVLAIAGALGFAGCGDDDEEPTTTATESGATGATGESGSAGSLPADAITAGNEICTNGDEELQKAFGQLDENSSEAQVEQVVTDEIVPSIQGQIDDLREIDDSEELASVLDDAEEALGEVEADPSLITSGEDPFDDINNAFRELGLDACAD